MFRYKLRDKYQINICVGIKKSVEKKHDHFFFSDIAAQFYQSYIF